jgi:RHS repeat-associated protein
MKSTLQFYRTCANRLRPTKQTKIKNLNRQDAKFQEFRTKSFNPPVPLSSLASWRFIILPLSFKIQNSSSKILSPSLSRPRNQTHKTKMKTKLMFALVASLTSTAFAAFQAPLPEFKNEKQLAEWRAEKASEATSRGYATEQTVFYTGRPYIASSGDYAFKYRNYNPGLARWTSEDPSGFPDGANSISYAPTPTTQIDRMGLAAISLAGSTDADINGPSITMTFREDGKPKQIGSTIAAQTSVEFSAAGLTGWIVQMITNDWSGVKNDSDNSKYTPANPPTQKYWEAWRVALGTVSYGGADDWNTIAFPENTHGKFVVSGKFQFYSDTAVSESIPSSWTDGVPEAGPLYSTKTQPSWWTGSGHDRNLTMTWE